MGQPRTPVGTVEEAKANFLHLITRPDATTTSVMRQLGRAVNSYYKWRADDDEFRIRSDEAQRQRHTGTSTQWTGDFASFRDTYLKLEYPTPPFHRHIINKLESAPPMSISMFLTFPNAGKSTLLEDWINYKLAVDPNHRITIVSKSQGQARKMLARVQRRMTDMNVSGAYIARFGPFYQEGQQNAGKPWTRDYFTVAKANHDERDYSLQVLGWSGQIYGSRVDTLILDDIQTRDNLTQIAGMVDKFRLEHVSRIGDHGRVIIIGTRIEVGDIYEYFVEHDVIDRGQTIILPAVNHEGKSLWPERWPKDKLDKMRSMVGEKAWWCGYMQRPQLAGTATFTEQMVDDAKDPKRSIGTGRDGIRRHGLPVVIGLDPALGGGNAVTALAYDNTQIYVLDVQKNVELARTEEILEIIESFAIRYEPNDLVVEINAFQRSLARDDRLIALSRKYGFRVHEHTTGRGKVDPILGVGSMAGSFLRQEFSIPWGDDTTRARMEPFCAELRSWRPNIATKLLTQDMVMSCWFAWRWVMERRRFAGVSNSDWRRSGITHPTNVRAALAGRN